MKQPDVISLVVGKRTREQTNALVQDAKSHLYPGHLPATFTDAYNGYVSAILAVFGRRYPVYRGVGMNSRTAS
jgi:hypothetical protein